MTITIWDIFKYIFKWKVLVAVIAIVSIVAANYYVNKRQTYSAEIVIRYIDPNAKQGLNPKSGKLDVYEMVSPSVVQGAINDLGIKTSVELIRRNIVINPIIPQSVLDLKASNAKEGKEYVYFPIDYSIKYTVDSTKNGAYARDILEAIMKNYNKFYSDKYLTQSTLPQIDYDVDIKKHDYIEIAEVMEQKVRETILFLEARIEENPTFRSSRTGLSFNNLNKEYQALKSYNIPSLYSYIYMGKVTTNKEILLKKYKYRQDQLLLENKNKTEQTDLAYNLMLDYARNNILRRDSNTNNGSNTNNNDINNGYFGQNTKPSKTTYDVLVDNYVDSGVEASSLLVDAEYCKTVIDVFSTENTDLNMNTQMQEKATTSITYISDKIKNLYTTTDLSIRDYNDLRANKYVTALSAVTISIGMSAKLYMFIALVVGVGLGILVAITIEIISRVKNKDKKLKKSKKKVLNKKINTKKHQGEEAISN